MFSFHNPVDPNQDIKGKRGPKHDQEAAGLEYGG